MHESFDFHFNYIKWIAKSVKKWREKNYIIPLKLFTKRSSTLRDVRFSIMDEISLET